MQQKKRNIRRWSVALLFFGLAISSPTLRAQTYEWEIDKAREREVVNRRKRDSLMHHLEHRWEASLTYGRLLFPNSVRSDEEALFVLPGSIGGWQLAGSWHYSERLGAEFSLGIQVKRDVPGSPDFLAVLGGDDIALEGSGAGFLPVQLGVFYYLRKQRFRPLVGIQQGFVLAQSRHTLAEGNLNTGITRTDQKVSDRVWLGGFRAGFDYRLGWRTQARFRCFRFMSGAFTAPIGGYERYQGWTLEAGLSFVF